MKDLLSFIKKYKHGLVIVAYFLIYILLFGYLENRTVYRYHVVHTVFDDMIPFCEFFVIPYLLWFPYMVFAIFYFIFKNENKHEYYQFIFNLMMGMTVFLIVSYIYPNVQHLRPSEFTRDNLFIDLVKYVYKADTPTNILPSIHVFNSLAVHMAITSCEALKNKRAVRYGSLFLTAMIILSTMFLKQHSVIDVFIGATLALFGYLVFYPSKVQDPVKGAKSRSLSNARNHKEKRYKL